MRNFLDVGYSPTADAPKRVKVGSEEHNHNSSYLETWASQLKAVLWRCQDSKEGEDYEQRLLSHGLWTCTIQRDPETSLILCLIISHQDITWCLGAHLPYTELLHHAALILRSMTHHDPQRKKPTQPPPITPLPTPPPNGTWDWWDDPE